MGNSNSELKKAVNVSALSSFSRKIEEKKYTFVSLQAPSIVAIGQHDEKLMKLLASQLAAHVVDLKILLEENDGVSLLESERGRILMDDSETLLGILKCCLNSDGGVCGNSALSTPLPINQIFPSMSTLNVSYLSQEEVGEPAQDSKENENIDESVYVHFEIIRRSNNDIDASIPNERKALHKMSAFGQQFKELLKGSEEAIYENFEIIRQNIRGSNDRLSEEDSMYVNSNILNCVRVIQQNNASPPFNKPPLALPRKKTN